MVTPVTHTVGTTGRDFATLAALVADIGVGISGDLIVDDEDWTIDVYNDGLISETAKSDFNAALGTTNTDATHRIVIKAATGEGFRDNLTASDALKYYGTSKGAAFSCATVRLIDQCPYLTLEEMQATTNGNVGIIDGENRTEAGARNCILETRAGGTSGRVLTRTRVAENLAVFTHAAASPAIAMVASLPVINCTVIRYSDAAASGTETGISNGSGDIINSFAFGFNTCISSSGTQTKVAATDATGSEAGLDNLTATDQVEGMATSDIDARIKSTGALDDAGGAGGIATDILGTTRVGNGDIGAFELVAAAAAGNPWNYYAQQ